MISWGSGYRSHEPSILYQFSEKTCNIFRNQKDLALQGILTTAPDWFPCQNWSSQQHLRTVNQTTVYQWIYFRACNRHVKTSIYIYFSWCISSFLSQKPIFLKLECMCLFEPERLTIQYKQWYVRMKLIGSSWPVWEGTRDVYKMSRWICVSSCFYFQWLSLNPRQ